MNDPDETLSAAGHESDGPDSDTPNLSDADGGDGAPEHGQGEGGADDSADDTLPGSDNSTPDDDDQDDVLRALADGRMDDLDAQGKLKPKVEAKKDDTPPEETPPAKTPEEIEAEAAAAKAKDDDDRTPEEKAALEKSTKGSRKLAEQLFKERSALRKEVETSKAEVTAKTQEVEALKPAKTFADNVIQDLLDAGLASKKADGKLDYKGFINLLATERHLRNKKPAEIAAHYRKLADHIDPSSRPVTLATDLADQVTSQILSKEEAEHIQRLRDEKANPPAKDDHIDEDPEEVEQETARVREERLQARQKAEDVALGEISTVFKGYETRYGDQWPAIKKTVLENLRPLVKEASPKLWKQLAEKEIKLVLAEKRTPLKVPAKNPPAQGNPPRKNKTPTEAEEAEALAAGKLT